MRIRTLKPEFWTHPVIIRLEDSAKLLAIALLNYADDDGYFYADEDLIRGALMPKEESTNIRRSIDELVEIGYIQVAEHSTHGPIGYIDNFRKHQRIDRPKKSTIKDLFSSTKDRRSLEDETAQEQGNEGTREQGNEGKEDCPEQAPPAPAPTPSPVVLKIPIVPKGNTHPVTQRDLDGFAAYYPGIDVAQSLREAAAWCEANPKRRKTKTGVKSFLTSWLSRDQNDPRKTKTTNFNGKADHAEHHGKYEKAF